jgi:succinyl-CoA synthetase beta subunit
MNTVDALTIHGGHCANFLDTGGKATSETVKSSFRIICSDPRVNAVFVNIFGGLTRCDMIAEGIIMAFRDLGMKVPVVVRLRGTNEELGQKMVRYPKRYADLLFNLLIPIGDRLRRAVSLSMRLMDLRTRPRR